MRTSTPLCAALALSLACVATTRGQEQRLPAAPAAAGGGGAYRKVLDGGIEIELLAVAAPRSEDRRYRRDHPEMAGKRVLAADMPPFWWAPDGKPIERPEFRRVHHHPFASHQVAVRVVGVDDYEVAASCNLAPDDIAKPHPADDPTGRRLKNVHIFNFGGLEQALRKSGAAAPDAWKGTIKVSLATGPWEELYAWEDDWPAKDRDRDRVEFSTNARLVLDLPRQQGADVVTDVVHAYLDAPVRMIAEDKHDHRRLHVAREEEKGGGVGLRRVLYRFKGMKLAELGMIKFQRRPFDRHAEFPAVVLIPGHSRDLFPWTGLNGLYGSPAPELRQVKGWKNGGPVRMADLKGKVVLLEFWNWQCGSCVYYMPNLMRLHEQYKDKGLVVLSVHADMADSVEDMDAKLARHREKLWGGRDLPFLVALDGGGETPVEGQDRRIAGATTAAYRITGWPTTLLVDRQGNLRGEVDLAKPDEAGKKVEELLAGP